MKKLTFFLLVGCISISTFSQNVKRPNQNADSVKHNSLGINISPILSMMLGGQDPETIKSSILYKHYGERFNFRLGAALSPEVVKKSFYEAFDDAGNSYEAPTMLGGGDIVNITDSTLMKRHFLKENYLFELNIGLEKAKQTKIGTMLLGLELGLGYFHKNEKYLYRDYVLPIVENDYLNFTEISYIAPNIEAPYSSGEFLKLGLNVIFGFEWRLTKHLNISTYVSPNAYVFIKLKEAYSDNEHFLTHTNYNTIEVDPGYLNVMASLKF